LRPGEKLFEELCYEGEHISHTSHPKIYRLECQAAPLREVRQLLNELVCQSDLVDRTEIKRLLQKAVPEYQPQLTPPSVSELDRPVVVRPLEASPDRKVMAVDFVPPPRELTA
jgi:hypothetical protein